jgi:hypothetical protein
MKQIVCLMAALALGGCASVKPEQAPSEAVDALKGQPLTAVTYTRPDFSAMTYGRAAIGGLIGGAVMISEGNAVVKDNDIPDPAVAIAARPAKLDDEVSLSRDAGHKGVLLDVETINWMFVYYPLDWTHYRIMYVGRARLIDANAGKRIAQAPCVYQSDDKTPPTYDQMMADKAALLKNMLAAAADSCVDKMSRTLYAQ